MRGNKLTNNPLVSSKDVGLIILLLICLRVGLRSSTEISYVRITDKTTLGKAFSKLKLDRADAEMILGRSDFAFTQTLGELGVDPDELWEHSNADRSYGEPYDYFVSKLCLGIASFILLRWIIILFLSTSQHDRTQKIRPHEKGPFDEPSTRSKIRMMRRNLRK